MKYIDVPSKEYLRSIFSYDPETGKLIWIKRVANKTKIGSEAGWKAKKYLQVTLNGHHYYVHRIIWQLVHGNLSNEDQIDHDDRNPLNNRLLNLEKVTQSINMKNQSMPKNNSSGIIGVSFHKFSGMWIGKITNQKKVEVSYHKTRNLAVDWRRQKECEYGFHPQHGKLT
jgi:hypothetical protein